MTRSHTPVPRTIAAFLSIASLTAIALAQTPVANSFTYQGSLNDANGPVNGPVNFVFRLYDAAMAGTLLGTQTLNGQNVDQGLFTVVLNDANQLGANPFNGSARWLEIAVDGNTLSPRQPLTAAPYALGIRLPLTEASASAADSINITQTGTGDAAQFNISNPANVGEAVEARTDGSGDAVQSVTTGAGRAGYFQISNTTSVSPALYATSNGNGPGLFSIKTAGGGASIHGEGPTGIIGELGTTAYGAYGENPSSGNFGYLATPTYGVRGQATSAGFGVFGSSIDGIGVQGSSTNDRGVYGVSANVDAVVGAASASARAGVLGTNDTSGGYGVFGRNTSGTTDRTGYLAGTYGVFGSSPSGGGVFQTPNGFTGAGCFAGASDSGDAFFASKDSGDGVAGRFQSDGADGADGVLIIHNNRGNCLDINNTNNTATSSRLADMTATGQGAFGLFVSVPAGHTGLSVISGLKNGVVRTSQGPRYLYCEEASEVWFTDYGFGELANGRASVQIDALMAETVDLTAAYHVFLQANFEECRGLAVVNRTPTSFDVVETNGGTSSGEFSYRLVAKRRGYTKERLEPCPQAELDPNLYPERRAEWEAQKRGMKSEPAIDATDRASQAPAQRDLSASQ